MNQLNCEENNSRMVLHNQCNTIPISNLQRTFSFDRGDFLCKVHAYDPLYNWVRVETRPRERGRREEKKSKVCNCGLSLTPYVRYTCDDESPYVYVRLIRREKKETEKILCGSCLNKVINSLIVNIHSESINFRFCSIFGFGNNFIINNS